jgi:hypothetical protein
MMSSITLETKDSLMIRWRLIESKVTKIKKFDLHRIANQLSSCLDFDNGMV